MVNINVIGRLGADVKLIEGSHGKFLKGRLAVDDWKDKSKTTTWFDVNFNSERAFRIQEYLTKGKLLQINGTESVELYNAKDGTPQISRIINVYNVDFVSVSKGNNDGEGDTVTTGELKEPKVLADPPMASKASTTSDDDLPF